MGLFDAFETVLDRVLPTAASFVLGGPAAALTTAAGVERAKKNEKIMERNMSIYAGFDEGQVRSTFPPVNTAPAGGNSFFGNLGQTIGGFGRDVGQFFRDIQPATQLFGVGETITQRAMGPAQSVIRQAPDETSQSGEILGANLGLGTGLVQAARGFARSPGGQALFGGGLGLAGGALMQGGNGAPRITRKMKSDVRKIYMMAGMDPNATAQILNNLGTYPRINFDANVVFFILTKRFRNDGPVVTKAAVRKTKTTLRRMKGVVDMYNSVCKPTTRRAPARRAAPKAVQLIKN